MDITDNSRDIECKNVSDYTMYNMCGTCVILQLFDCDISLKILSRPSACVDIYANGHDFYSLKGIVQPLKRGVMGGINR
jgi:hypothetical protein